MNKNYLLIALLFLAFSCTESKKAETESQTSAEAEKEVEKEDKKDVVITGYDSIEELAESLVASLKARDYDDYYSHVMSEEMELQQAEKLTDPEVKEEFLKEYGFSLHEEKEYFDDILKFFDSKDIDLDNVVMDDLVYTEYKGGEYEPLMLYEVIVPIEMEYEIPIDFTAILVDDKYYLTSELGI